MANRKVSAIAGVRNVVGVAETPADLASLVPVPVASNGSRRAQPVDSVEISSEGRDLASQDVNDAHSVRGWRVTS